MTIEDVRSRVAGVKALSGDPEAAHSAEDGLWTAVLQAIADGTAEDAAEMARLALTTTTLTFDRWYA